MYIGVGFVQRTIISFHKRVLYNEPTKDGVLCITFWHASIGTALYFTGNTRMAMFIVLNAIFIE